MQILIDRREQRTLTITEEFCKRGIPYKATTLSFGDYSFEYNSRDYRNILAIERKQNLSELANNLSWKRKQFEAEFIRAKEAGAKIYILIEDAKGREKLLKRREMEAEKKYSKAELQKGTWRSELTANSFIGTLTKWKERYGFEIVFTSKKNSGRKIVEIFENYIANSNNV